MNILLQHEKLIKENIKTVVIAEDRYNELLESERKYLDRDEKENN